MAYPIADFSAGNVQVTAESLNGSTTYCHVAFWNSYYGIMVECNQPDGTPADSQFVVSYTDGNRKVL